jgi:hypothetical protein
MRGGTSTPVVRSDMQYPVSVSGVMTCRNWYVVRGKQWIGRMVPFLVSLARAGSRYNAAGIQGRSSSRPMCCGGFSGRR